MKNETWPYDPPKPSDEFITSQSRSRSDFSTLISCTVAVSAILKWLLPAVLGTGAAMTLGTWVEEFVLVTVLGFACGLTKSRAVVYQPYLYFFVGYILPLPLIVRDQFFLLAYIIGIIASFFMYVGIGVGLAGRAIFDRQK